MGVISDTHGLVRDEALAALRDSDIILHAGDIGSPNVLHALERIAPTYAVRGNNDRDEWGRSLPLTEVVELGAHLVYLLHDIADLDVDPAAAGFSAVIYGHSHKPGIEQREGVLYLNPGSAGPRRFRLPIAVARMRVSDEGLQAELVELA
ncbi:MAG TPA: metallophosphoesterase family protein [Burkholderiales bacterium]|nr:metallophosphoesterase family protein [Burkholderiales bacterium]